MTALERLVLAPERTTVAWDIAANPTALVSDGGAFRWLLSERCPVLAVVFKPPAEAIELEVVLHERRRRDGLRAAFLNASPLVDERLLMLRAGFDEAMPIDMGLAELTGRLGLLVEQGREGSLANGHRISVADDVDLDPKAHELQVRGRGIHLRPRESALLEVMARQPGRTFTREELLAAMGSSPANNHVRTIDVHVRWLRAKLLSERASRVRLVTVRGHGYRLETR